MRAVKIQPDYSNALYSLGLLYERMGKSQEALSYFRKVQELNPNNPDIGRKVHQLLAPQ